jgi:hypothetical protein
MVKKAKSKVTDGKGKGNKGKHNSIGLKILASISLLVIIVCGVLGVLSYSKSSKALSNTIL